MMTIFSALAILGMLYLLLSGKAAKRSLSKTEKVLYHLILLLLFVQMLWRHTGLDKKDFSDIF